MNKFNPWTFGIIFLGIFLFLAWNNFNIRVFFFGETKNTKARIVDIKIVPGTAGRGSLQLVEYNYKIKDKIYKDKIKIGKKYGWQVIDNELLIKYLVNNPEKNRVVKFYNSLRNNKTLHSKTFHAEETSDTKIDTIVD